MTSIQPARLPWRGLLLVFLTYLYFLLFSQFTFLELLEQGVFEKHILKAILGLMAFGGISGSFSAIALRKRLRDGKVLPFLLAACAAISALVPFVDGALAFGAAAAVMGFLMGILTVAVASIVPALAVDGMRGRVLGLGTGLAYALSNLPVVFSAPAPVRSLICSGILVTGAVVLQSAGTIDGKGVIAGRVDRPAIAWTPLAVVALILAFLLLVWFDSAFFSLIQKTRALKDLSWEGESQLYLNAVLHLLAAVFSGYLLDRGLGSLVLAVAWLGLSAGAAGLQWLGHPAFTAFYVGGVSLYSVALVYIPSLHAGRAGDRATFIRAALVFSIAGWLGSGMGIGMAENLSRIPAAFILVTALVIIPVNRLRPYLR